MMNLSIKNPTSIINPSMMMSLLFLIVSAFQSVNSYTPVEHFVINCGSPADSNTTFGNRTWIGDVGSTLFSIVESESNQPSMAAYALLIQNSSIELVPYGTAIHSSSEFTYLVPVTAGPKFVRLHFYPATYGDHERWNSLFSVKAGPFTLLKDFNASFIADNDDDPEETIFREYCVYVEEGKNLNLTFTPSSSHPEAYAFVNGIEIVSMPSYLYYTNPDDRGFEMVGHDYLYETKNKSALETLYRINVGGRQISSEEDTGMFRYWDDDYRYLVKECPLSVPAAYGVTPTYKVIQNYSAPDVLYLTARTYGMGGAVTPNCNVSWEFKVDSQYMYMLRLHFCEFEAEIQSPGERVFQIFIADTLAESRADVIRWSTGNLVPVYKDYVVLFDKGSSKNLNLSIKMQPHPDPKVSDYADTILNGIEIFKLSDSRGSLGDSNHNPFSPSFLTPNKHTKNKKTTTVLIIVVVVVVAASTVLSIIGFLIFRRRLSGAQAKSKLEMISHDGNKSLSPFDLFCRNFSIIEIRAATINFDDIFIIGVGGFGNVYKGYIDDGAKPVAIKRLNPSSQQGAHEFKTEIEMLSQLSHPHLVSLIGYCNDENEMIIVYDFMANGTLRDHLYGSKTTPISWTERLQICIGAARGLHYLHTGARHKIIHRDVKTTNILLDEKWVAKISDFGLSKIGASGISKTHVTTFVKGSIGYLDPEYYMNHRLTEKSDVYSFGVVMLEVLCGRPPLLRTEDQDVPQARLVEWAGKCHSDGVIDHMVDPYLKGTIKKECLSEYVEMAMKCVLNEGNQRPSMSDVVGGLEFALQLQETTEGARFCESSTHDQEVHKSMVEDEIGLGG